MKSTEKMKLIQQLTIICSLTTLIEWIDFSIFALAFRDISDSIYGPTSGVWDQITRWISFTASYCARPIGSVAFGYIGDVQGRHVSMFQSLIGSGISIIMLALLPSYADIGRYSIILLYGIRILQGFFMAGEQHSATIYLLEQYNGPNRNLIASIVNAANGLGLIIGSIISIIIEPHNWRIPVLALGLITIPMAFYLKTFIDNNKDVLVNIAEENKGLSFIEYCRTGFSNSIKSYVYIFAISAAVAVYFYAGNIWWKNWCINTLGYDKLFVSYLSLAGIVIVMIMSGITGYLADKIGMANQMIIGLSLCPLGALIIFLSSLHNNLWIFPFAYGIPYGLFSPLATKYCSELVSKNKCLSVAFFWQVSAAFFGGFSPFMCELIYTTYGNLWLIIGIIGLVMSINILMVYNYKIEKQKIDSNGK